MICAGTSFSSPIVALYCSSWLVDAQGVGSSLRQHRTMALQSERVLLEPLLGRGGARQRHEVASALGRGQASRSILVERLLHLVGWGLLSANTARWLAEGAEQDGLDNDAVRCVARLGARCMYVGSARRDLLRTCCGDRPSMAMPKLTPLYVHALNKKTTTRLRM